MIKNILNSYSFLTIIIQMLSETMYSGLSHAISEGWWRQQGNAGRKAEKFDHL